MPPVYREVELTWGDRTYTVTPTFRLIQQIEQRVSVSAVLGSIANGTPKMSLLSEVVADLLRFGGCKDASAEDIYASLLSPEGSGAIQGICTAIMLAFIPEAQEAKPKANPLAQLLTAKIPSLSGPNTTSAPSGDSASNPPSSGE